MSFLDTNFDLDLSVEEVNGWSGLVSSNIGILPNGRSISPIYSSSSNTDEEIRAAMDAVIRALEQSSFYFDDDSFSLGEEASFQVTDTSGENPLNLNIDAFLPGADGVYEVDNLVHSALGVADLELSDVQQGFLNFSENSEVLPQ